VEPPAMLTRLRQRLAGEDDGISLVEMLVATFVLTVPLFALLGTMMASSKSVVDQRARADAVRVASAHLEQLQGMPYADVPISETPHDLGVQTTADGTQVRLERTVTAHRAADMEQVDATASPGDADVKLVTTTARWDSGGKTKEATFTTVLRPENVYQVTNGLITVFMSPDPTGIDMDPASPAYGRPAAPVQVSVTANYDISDFVRVFWRNSNDGLLRSATLTKQPSSDGEPGIQLWTGSLATSSIYRPVPPTEEDPTMTFTVTGGALSTSYSLKLEPRLPNPPVIGAPTVSPSPIPVKREQGQCNQPTKCTNTQAVTITVDVTQLTETLDSADAVRVKFLLWDGTQQEVSLVRSLTNFQRWSVTFPRDSTKFMIGESQPFIFTAKRVSDGATVTRQVNLRVVEVK
jgi:Tfp pilus assembly protein PilV